MPGWAGSRAKCEDRAQLSGAEDSALGWNELKIVQPHSLLKASRPRRMPIFVHSYQFVPPWPDDLLATTIMAAPSRR